MNKTAIEWLEIARQRGENWVDAAIENIEAQPDYAQRMNNYPTLCSVIVHEFSWEKTDKETQGVDYWDCVHSRVFEYELQNPYMTEQNLIDALVVFLNGEVAPATMTLVFDELNKGLSITERRNSDAVRTAIEDFPFIYEGRWKYISNLK